MEIKYLTKNKSETDKIEKAGIWWDFEEMKSIVRDYENSAIVPSPEEGWLILVIPGLDDMYSHYL